MLQSIKDAAKEIVDHAQIMNYSLAQIAIACEEQWNYRVLSRADALEILDATENPGAWNATGPMQSDDHDEIVRMMAEACALADLRQAVNKLLKE